MLATAAIQARAQCDSSVSDLRDVSCRHRNASSSGLKNARCRHCNASLLIPRFACQLGSRRFSDEARPLCSSIDPKLRHFSIKPEKITLPRTPTTDPRVSNDSDPSRDPYCGNFQMKPRCSHHHGVWLTRSVSDDSGFLD